MDEAARFAFYEKIYFYELERKEKLISRLNLPLAILGVLLTFLSYMLAKPPSSEDGFAGAHFGFCICPPSSACCAELITSARLGNCVISTGGSQP